MRLHARNKNFTWVDAISPFEVISQTQADSYNESGGFVLENAFSPEEVGELTAVLDELESESNNYLRSEQGGRSNISRADEIVFRPHVVNAHPTVKKFATHPTLVGLCHDLVGRTARLYWDQLVYKRAKTLTEFPWHQDNGYTFLEPQQYLTCWVALTDSTKENGCPWIAPGVHRLGTLVHQWTDLGFQCFDSMPDEAAPMELKAGSIAVFSSLAPHKTGPNVTEEIRKAYILQYARDGAIAHPHGGHPFLADDHERQFLIEGACSQ